jgi:hypothetical protein
MNIQWLRSLYWPTDSYFSLLLSILYEYYMKKEARATEKAIFANIPCLCAKSQA